MPEMVGIGRESRRRSGLR